MNPRPASNKLATNSLTFGILGWIIYLMQWCFDLTIGLLLAVASAGVSTLCATALDLLPFVLWLIGIVSGHVALAQIQRTGTPGRGRAAWGLALSYLGIFFTILLIVIIVSLIASGIRVGVLDKILPFFTRH